jgi:ABC-type ATPase with predicted acetyltransferase domain
MADNSQPSLWVCTHCGFSIRSETQPKKLTCNSNPAGKSAGHDYQVSAR